MSILREVGLPEIKTPIWQLEAARMLVEAAPPEVAQIPETAVQEFNGLSNDLQSLLFRRSANLPESKPEQNSEPTFPNAPLFSQGAGDTDAVDFDDVRQGNFGDCYLMASLASIARDNPDQIRDMVRENVDADGNVTSYTVTFNEKTGGFLGIGQHYEEVEIEVLPSEVLADGANPADNGEIWVKVIETAFAEHMGGVDEIANGGNPADTMEILTGDESSRYDLDDYSFDSLSTDFANGEEIVLSSNGDNKKHELGGYGVYGNHAYMVEKVYTDENGQEMVQLYNPWGSDHPKPIPYSELDTYFSEIGVN